MALDAFGFTKREMLCDKELEFNIPKTAYVAVLHVEFTNCLWKYKIKKGIGIHKHNKCLKSSHQRESKMLVLLQKMLSVTFCAGLKSGWRVNLQKKKNNNQRCQSQGTTFHEFPRKLIYDCHLGVSQCNMVSVNLFYPIGWGIKTPLY